MAEIGINLTGEIYAEIAEGSFTMLSNSSVTLDPLTRSYSTEGLIYYNLEVVFSSGVSNIRLLNNGKNSRVSAAGTGYFQVQLTVRDNIDRTATDVIIITVE